MRRLLVGGLPLVLTLVVGGLLGLVAAGHAGLRLRSDVRQVYAAYRAQVAARALPAWMGALAWFGMELPHYVFCWVPLRAGRAIFRPGRRQGARPSAGRDG